MESITLVIDIIQIILLVYLGGGVVYLFLLSFSGLFRKSIEYKKNPENASFAVFIPAYKEDVVILEVAADAIKQDYPKDKFEVIVIADKLKPATIETLRAIPVTVIEVQFDKSTKSKSLNKAFEQLPEKYDYALILDADNIMEPLFLQKLNNAFNSNFFGVQGHRVAKNMNTPVAVLDAVSEEINNHLFRRGNRALGLSSSLIGSGMAFKYNELKKIMAGIQAIGGFDKELELYMTRNNLKVEFLENAMVYDEKVQSFDNFSNQRRRWLSAQFIYFGRNILPSLGLLFSKGNFDYFNRCIQQVFLPRVLLLGTLTIIFALSIIFDRSIFTWYWLSTWALIVFTLLIAVPAKMYNADTLKAVLYLPKGFILMFKALFSIKGANKTFIHTEHGIKQEKK